MSVCVKEGWEDQETGGSAHLTSPSVISGHYPYFENKITWNRRLNQQIIQFCKYYLTISPSEIVPKNVDAVLKGIGVKRAPE